MKNITKVLIAEDEILIARVLKMILERKNIEVKHVLDRENVVESTKLFLPDLVILDVQLKNKSCGVGAGKEIRKNGYSGPIIFTTGNSREETQKEMEGIINTYLFTKPIDPNELVKFIESEL